MRWRFKSPASLLFPDVQPCGMSDWQMTHKNDIAYASWDFNSLATYCLLNSLLRQTWNKTSSRAFVKGIHRRWDRRTLNHQSGGGGVGGGGVWTPDPRKHQSSTSLAFVRGIHQWPVNSPHKRPVTRKIFHLMTSSCTERDLSDSSSRWTADLVKCCF